MYTLRNINGGMTTEVRLSIAIVRAISRILCFQLLSTRCLSFSSFSSRAVLCTVQLSRVENTCAKGMRRLHELRTRVSLHFITLCHPMHTVHTVRAHSLRVLFIFYTFIFILNPPLGEMIRDYIQVGILILLPVWCMSRHVSTFELGFCIIST